MSKKQQITPDQEMELWDKKEMDMDTSQGLTRAVIFYIIKCFGLWQGKDMRQLTTEHLNFGEDSSGKFVSFDLTFLNNGKLIKRYDHPGNPRSVYKIFKKFRSYVANEGPLLVRPITSIKDYICYSPWPLGIGIIDQTVQTMMEDAGMGHLYGNISVSLHAIETLRMFGAGSHCIATWMLRLYPIYVRSMCDVFRECTELNCEDRSDQVCLMISRLLDTPFPADAFDMIQKMEKEEHMIRLNNAKRLNNFDAWMTNISDTPISEIGESVGLNDVAVGKEIKKKKKVAIARKKTAIENNKKTNSKVTVKGLNEKVPLINIKTEKDDDTYDKAMRDSQKSEEEPEPERNLKIITVHSIPESAFSVQIDEAQETNVKDEICENGNINDSVPLEMGKSIVVGKRSREESGLMKVENGEIINDDKSVGTPEPKVQRTECQSRIPLNSDVDEDVGPESEKVNISVCKGHSDYSEVSEDEDSSVAVYNDDILMSDESEGDTEEGHETVDLDKETCVTSSEKLVSLLLREGPSNQKNSDDNLNAEKGKTTKDVLENNATATEKSKSSVVKKAKDGSKGSLSRILPGGGEDSIQILRKLLMKESSLNSQNDKKEVVKLNPKSVTAHSEVTLADNEDVKDESGDERSPPILSPQPGCVDLSHADSNTSNGVLDVSQAPDIVKFLDTAHLQMQNLLNPSSVSGQKEETSLFNLKRLSAIGKLGSKSGVDKKEGVTKGKRSDLVVKTKIDSTSLCSEQEEVSETGMLTEENENDVACPLLRSVLEKPLDQINSLKGKSGISQKVPKNKTKSNDSHFISFKLKVPLTLETHNELEKREKNETQQPQSSHGNCSATNNKYKMLDVVSVSCENSLDFTCEDLDEAAPPESVSNFLNISRTAPQKKVKNVEIGHKSSTLNSHQPLLLTSGANSSLQTSSLAEQLAEEGKNCALYHFENSFIDSVAYQSLRISSRTKGSRTFTFADLPTEKHHDKRDRLTGRVTSEINLGDYFPPGTLIPAEGLRLVTQCGPMGNELLLKFDYGAHQVPVLNENCVENVVVDSEEEQD